MQRYLFVIVSLVTIGFLTILLHPQKSGAWHRPIPWWFRTSISPIPITPFLSFKPISAPIPSPTLTLAPKITLTPSPTPFIISKQMYMMDQINEYRKSKGLTRVSIDSYTCDFANIRAKEISSNFSHNGFRTRIDNKTLPYPSFSLVTENITMNPDYKKVVESWIKSSGHAENMRKDTPYVCVENVGDYYSYEGWKP